MEGVFINKKNQFLNAISNLEPDIERHLNRLNNRFIRALLVKEKAILKVLGILIRKIFNFDIEYKIKTFFGRTMKNFLGDKMASPLFFFNILYGEEPKIIKFLIKNLKKDEIFYDIGANFKFYILLAQELIGQKEGEIHSFEPLPKIFALLKENALINKYKNTYLNNLALSDKIGIINFCDRTPQGHSGGSTIVFDFYNKKGNIIKVQSTTLDNYINFHKVPTLMKIDVEGAEYLVLKGGEKTVLQYNPTIIMEFTNDELHQNAVDFLIKNGYRMFRLDKNEECQIVPEQSIDKIYKNQIKAEANYIFIKQKNELIWIK